MAEPISRFSLSSTWLQQLLPKTSLERKIRRMGLEKSLCPHLDLSKIKDVHFQVIEGRTQCIDYQGSVVLTDVSKLPSGGGALTLTTGGRTPELFFIGDFGFKGTQQEKVFADLADAVQSSKQEGRFPLVFGVGDWQYPRGPVQDSPEEKRHFEETSLSACSAVAQDAEAFFGVLGNHEYGDAGGPANPRLMMKWTRQAGIQFPGRYYSLELKAADYDIDVMVLDTAVLSVDPRQVEWLKNAMSVSHDKEAATGRARRRFLIGHHPPLTHGYHSDENLFFTKIWGDVLGQFDGYFAGHEHEQEILVKNVPSGIQLPPVIISGTASESHELFGASSDFHNSKAGFSRLLLDEKMGAGKAQIELRDSLAKKYLGGIKV